MRAARFPLEAARFAGASARRRGLSLEMARNHELEAGESDAGGTLRRALANLLLALLAAAAALSGCASPPTPAAAEAVLEWPAMAVRVTAPLPGEEDGRIHAAWRDGRFGLLTPGTAGLPVHTVVADGQVSVSQTGEGWTRWPLADYQATHPAALRLTFWNLPLLLEQAGVAPKLGHTSVDLDLDGLGGPESRLDVEVVGAHVETARLETPLDLGAPFTFTQQEPRAIPLDGDPALEPATVLQGDARALQGHQAILAWARQYREQLGSVPDELTPQTLALQSLGRQWPTSPYDGQPMRGGGPMGHFVWQRCGADAAEFTGKGWDGATIRQTFGAGCPLAGLLPPPA